MKEGGMLTTKRKTKDLHIVDPAKPPVTVAHSAKRIKLCNDESSTKVNSAMMNMNNKFRGGKQEREMIRQFVLFTNTNENIALTCLQNCHWSVERACDSYFQNPNYFNSMSDVTDVTKIEALFRNYVNDPNDDVGTDRIGPHGMLRLLNDLQVDPTSRMALILAWKLKAATQCEFSEHEFVSGLAAMKYVEFLSFKYSSTSGNNARGDGVFERPRPLTLPAICRTDSLEKLRAKLPQVNEELYRKDKEGEAALRSLYGYAFHFGRSCAQRTLPIDVAFAYWNIIFEDHNRYPAYPILEKFLSEREQKGISRDQWNLVFDYMRDVGLDISKYDTNGAWPVLLDEFVEYIKTTHQQA